MMLVVWFGMSTVNPVENVQSSISTHEEDVVSRQVLHFTVTLQDNKLGQNGNGFQVNWERPKELHDVKGCEPSTDQMSNDSKEKTRGCSKFPVQERILSLVVRGLDRLLELDGVNDGSSCTDVQHLHDWVVDRVESCEQIQIPRDEYQEEKLMRSDRYTYNEKTR